MHLTGWHSVAASAPGEAFKSNDLAREAVNCNAVLGRRFARAVQLNQDLGRDA